MTKETPQKTSLTVPPPNLQIAEFRIIGTAPYVQNKFSEKAETEMREKQEAKSQSEKKRKKEPKNFQQCYEDAMHVSEEGWCGIPAAAFRNACIRACKLVGIPMTDAKNSIFILADGFDRDDGMPLVKITKGDPEPNQTHVRIGQNKPDLRIRPMWRAGWEAVVRIEFDADQFAIQDVANLMMRVGIQVGVGEGRPNSKASDAGGMGWGVFRLADE